jgi:hypothetical protein
MRGDWPHRTHYALPYAPYVGQGSIFGHTPGDVENELDQLHSEIMGFGQQLIELIKNEDDQAKAVVQKVRAEELAAWKVVESFQPLVKARDQARDAFAKNPSRLSDFVAAEQALEKFMPAARRQEVSARANELSQRRADLEYKARGEMPLTQWRRSTWEPFLAGWMKFHGEKKDIPLQAWPLSGTWDRIQDYRKQFVDLYSNAPFKPTGPSPLDPDRKDPSITAGLEKFGKYILIGGLAIAGVVGVSVVASRRKR